MAAMNRLPSMLWTSLSFTFLLYSCSDPTKIFSDAAREKGTIKGMFVFGSSFFDSGTSGFLETSLKADFLPYGIDFPDGPTGRFTNGKTYIDVLGELLNISTFIPPFNDPSTKGNHAAVGVSFACGASGILDETNSSAGGVLSLNEQIKKFEEVTLPEFEKQGKNSSRESLSKYLFVVGSGEKDYIFNYFMNRSKSKPSVKAFTDNLIANLSSQLKKLHSLGAQKFVVMGLYPMGCSPRNLVVEEPGQERVCDKSLNNAALTFNYNLKTLVRRIKPEMSGSNLVMVNAYKIIEEILIDPASQGFTQIRYSCCEVVSKEDHGNGISCEKEEDTCDDRKEHVYYDGQHPTEAVNVALGAASYRFVDVAQVYPFKVVRFGGTKVCSHRFVSSGLQPPKPCCTATGEEGLQSLNSTAQDSLTQRNLVAKFHQRQKGEMGFYARKMDEMRRQEQ
ncbi:GDSL-like Lipase/Acylhydrolase superfamily protein [Heracleum sosnowskyi]|uniref:GDSL-like Lipase/Acylhydrolase superfamily protein n=1 Tax=Heracleum sosnowskyi TaxID=360622 RepID=A0AAD8MDR2_9APIA|nr:GDSL-like Lipase/Acylhydrolase superfamily protein [Heracleum sosnowskyi]